MLNPLNAIELYLFFIMLYGSLAFLIAMVMIMIVSFFREDRRYKRNKKFRKKNLLGKNVSIFSHSKYTKGTVVSDDGKHCVINVKVKRAFISPT